MRNKSLRAWPLLLLVGAWILTNWATEGISDRKNSCDCPTPPPANTVRVPVIPCLPGDILFLETVCIPTSPDPPRACAPLPAAFDGASDFCHFYLPQVGIAAISAERWKQAQSVESTVWDGSASGADRNEQHAVWFDHYKAVHGHLLGKILEVGSGPFTQTKTVIEKIQGRGERPGIQSITLADPLMLFYHAQVPSCSYKSGSLLGYPTQFIASGGEDLMLRDEFDTVVMMNVLEHCRDAFAVLENLHAAVKPGTGVLIFSERWYDAKWEKYDRERVPFWDVMHPINIKRTLIEALLSHYTPIYRRNFFYEGDYPTDEGVYFIGTKKIF